VKPLKPQQLSVTLPAVADFKERVRERLREEKASKGLSERDIADLIQWTQSKVAQKLSGRTPITLEELEALCFALSLSPTEAVRDRGLEFCSELTPTELRTLEKLRGLDPTTRAAFLQLLDVKVKVAQPERYATPVKNSVLGRPRK
jgi:transcriptional regulator with XRE-family HTH domain